MIYTWLLVFPDFVLAGVSLVEPAGEVGLLFPPSLSAQGKETLQGICCDFFSLLLAVTGMCGVRGNVFAAAPGGSTPLPPACECPNWIKAFK